MDFVENLVELQVVYHVYTNQHNSDRQTIIKNLKGILEYLEIYDLSVRAIQTIIELTSSHPVITQIVEYQYTTKEEMGRELLRLRGAVLSSYHKKNGPKYLYTTKRISKKKMSGTSHPVCHKTEKDLMRM